MNREKCIRAIVLAGEKLAQLEFFQPVKQAVVFDSDFFLGMRASSGIAFFRCQLV